MKRWSRTSTGSQTSEYKQLLKRYFQLFQVPEFKAQLMPDFDTVVLPERKKLESTKPEPFRLMADERGAIKNNRLEQAV